MSAIALRGLVKRYDTFTLGPIDLDLEWGYVTGFVGVNGSGRTTTIKSMLGMLRPEAGTVTAPPRGDIGVVFDAAPYEALCGPSPESDALSPRSIRPGRSRVSTRWSSGSRYPAPPRCTRSRAACR